MRTASVARRRAPRPSARPLCARPPPPDAGLRRRARERAFRYGQSSVNPPGSTYYAASSAASGKSGATSSASVNLALGLGAVFAVFATML